MPLHLVRDAICGLSLDAARLLIMELRFIHSIEQVVGSIKRLALKRGQTKHDDDGQLHGFDAGGSGICGSFKSDGGRLVAGRSKLVP